MRGRPLPAGLGWLQGGLLLSRVLETSAAWTLEETAEGGACTLEYPSLALDRDDRPRIACYDRDAGDLKLASWDGADWSIEVVDSRDDVGVQPSLALSPSTLRARPP